VIPGHFLVCSAPRSLKTCSSAGKTRSSAQVPDNRHDNCISLRRPESSSRSYSTRGTAAPAREARSVLDDACCAISDQRLTVKPDTAASVEVAARTTPPHSMRTRAGPGSSSQHSGGWVEVKSVRRDLNRARRISELAQHFRR
jgi:hypothetical protein